MKKMVFLALSAYILVGLAACGEDDDAPTPVCIAPSCGDINENATNVTVFLEGNQELKGISVSVLAPGSQGDPEINILSTDGYDPENGENFTCWQTMPDIEEGSTVLVGYEVDEFVEFYSFSSANLSSNKLIITIDGETASIEDYEDECNDN